MRAVGVENELGTTVASPLLSPVLGALVGVRLFCINIMYSSSISLVEEGSGDSPDEVLSYT